MKPTYPSNEHQQATSDRHEIRRRAENGSRAMTDQDHEAIRQAEHKRARKAAKRSEVSK